MTAPPAPFVPPDLRGRPAVSLFVAYIGPVEDGVRELRPRQEFASPAVDTISPRTYLEFQAMTDPGNPPGRRNYWRSGFLRELSDEAIDAFLACTVGLISPFSVQVLGRAGGAIADVPDDATPISGRSAPWQFHCYGSWEHSDDDPHIAWVRATEQAMRPWTMAGMSLNFFSAIDPQLVHNTFGAEKFARLVALKTTYDPENVFCLNQNIPPAPSPRSAPVTANFAGASVTFGAPRV